MRVNIVTALVIGSWCSSVCAQTAQSDGQLEEVVVTAQRREQSLMEVPIAVTALSSEQLQDFGVQNFADYARQVPNLAYGYGGGAAGGGYGFSNTRQTVIRGVAGQNTTSLYIDDTPVPNVIDPRVLDLDRIEVLRGPQGTLFGASSMGGTLRLITRRPRAKGASASGQLTGQAFDVSEGDTGYDFSGTANIPLVQDTLGLGLAAFYSSTSGWLSRRFGVETYAPLTWNPALPQVEGKIDDVGETESSGGILSLHLTPAGLPNFSTTLTVIAQDTEKDGLPSSDNFDAADPRDLTQHRPFNLREGFEDQWQFIGLSGRYDFGVGSLIGSVSYFDQESFDQQDGTSWVAYCQIEFSAFGFCPVVGYWPSPTTQTTDLRQSTAELRYETAFNGPINLVIGGFYQRFTSDRLIDMQTPGIDAASGGQYGTDLFFQGGTDAEDTQFAGFADVTFRPTDKIELSAGVRKSQYETERFQFSQGYFGLGADAAPRENKEDPLTSRFVAQYKFTDANMVYASAAEGFRSGGESLVFTGPCGAEIASLGFPEGEPVTYTSDSLWSYEFGLKNAFAQRRISTRVAAYFIDWKDIQQNLVLPTCGISITANFGAAEIKGVELEADVRATDNLTLTLGLGYTDAQITEGKTLPTGESVGYEIGDPLSGVPEWTGSLRAEYSYPAKWGDIFVRAAYSYVGSSVSFNGGRPGIERPGYDTLDARFGFELDAWTATIFVKNATDERGHLGDVIDIVGIVPGIQQSVIIQPRTIGLEVQRRW